MNMNHCCMQNRGALIIALLSGPWDHCAIVLGEEAGSNEDQQR